MSNNISPESKLIEFGLPSNSFYGKGKLTNNSTFDCSAMSENSPTSRISGTVFKQSSSKTIIEETFSEQFEPLSTDSKKSLLSLPSDSKDMEIPRSRSPSPDWVTSRFSIPALKKKKYRKEQIKRRSVSKEKNCDEEEAMKENNHRSVSPDWTTSRFSLSPLRTRKSTSSFTKKKKTSSLVNRNSIPRQKRSSSTRSVSPDWNNSSFSLPQKSKSPVVMLKSRYKKIKSASPIITASLTHRHKTNNNKNSWYTISQKTLDKLLPKPEICLFDVVKYGLQSDHKDDFLFGLNLMRSEVLNKIDLLHYKKKLRNTGMDFIRTFQQTRKSTSKTEKSYPKDLTKMKEQKERLVAIEIPDDVIGTTEEIHPTDEIDTPLEVIQIDDDDKDENTDKLLEEAIQDVDDKHGSEVVDEVTEKSNVIKSNDNNNLIFNNINGAAKTNSSDKETAKIIETNTFYHNVTKKRNSLDSKIKLISKPRNTDLSPNKNIKKSGFSKKNPLANKKKNIIKVKWPIARKSLLDLRDNS